MGIGNSPVFFGNSMICRDDLRSTIWMIGSDFRDATATVFFPRPPLSLPVPPLLRAAGLAVVPRLLRIKSPAGSK